MFTARDDDKFCVKLSSQLQQQITNTSTVHFCVALLSLQTKSATSPFNLPLGWMDSVLTYSRVACSLPEMMTNFVSSSVLSCNSKLQICQLSTSILFSCTILKLSKCKGTSLRSHNRMPISGLPLNAHFQMA